MPGSASRPFEATTVPAVIAVGGWHQQVPGSSSSRGLVSQGASLLAALQPAEGVDGAGRFTAAARICTGLRGRLERSEQGPDGRRTEAARLLADLTGWPVRRRLGAGRTDDTGDLDGIPDTCIQVKDRGTYDRVPTYLAELRQQQANAQATFAALLLRRRGGRYIAVMDLDQLATLLREATTP